MLFQFVCAITLLYHNAAFAEAQDLSVNGTQNAPAQECGIITTAGESLVLRGVTPKRGVAPWHVSIYRKTSKPYMLICGGSLVRNDIVISSASCFWGPLGGQEPASHYAIAVGKQYRPWNDPADVGAQKSDVKQIHIPNMFHGSEANYKDDLSLLILATPISYNSYIQPVCLSFDAELDKQQLSSGNKGKFTSWRLDEQNKSPPVLKSVELPYKDLESCYSKSPITFTEYITADKFCVGPLSSDAMICKGDGGAGLSFDSGVDRYYLRGVASVMPSIDSLCASQGIIAFTHLIRHENFIKNILSTDV